MTVHGETCARYKSFAAVRHDRVGNLPSLLGIFRDYLAPNVHIGADGIRELVIARGYAWFASLQRLGKPIASGPSPAAQRLPLKTLPLKLRRSVRKVLGTSRLPAACEWGSRSFLLRAEEIVKWLGILAALAVSSVSAHTQVLNNNGRSIYASGADQNSRPIYRPRFNPYGTVGRRLTRPVPSTVPLDGYGTGRAYQPYKDYYGMGVPR